MMLYCLYKVSLGCRSKVPPVDATLQFPHEFVAALQLDDISQVWNVHRELLEVGAIGERQEVCDDGEVRRLVEVYELSPRQFAEADKRCDVLSGSLPSVGKNGGKIYVIRPVGSRPVKIGYSATVQGRLRSLQSSNPTKLELLWQAVGS
ncbi:hypothetical protein GCM10027199_73950 [Amycolatopsis magusensis]